MIEWRKETTGTCKAIKQVPKGAEIVAVNGREAIGTCEVCGHPILVNQKHYADSEGVVWHKRCPRPSR